MIHEKSNTLLTHGGFVIAHEKGPANARTIRRFDIVGEFAFHDRDEFDEFTRNLVRVFERQLSESPRDAFAICTREAFELALQIERNQATLPLDGENGHWGGIGEALSCRDASQSPEANNAERMAIQKAALAIPMD